MAKDDVTAEPTPPAAPVNDGNQDFPIAFSRWAPMLVGTPDEIWTVHMKKMHGRENHTVGDWHRLIENYRHQPAHPSVLSRS